MSRYRIVVASPLPPEAAWRRLWDLREHTRLVPLTTVRVVGGAASPAAGSRVVARTALGPLRVDDVMEVARWEPPAGRGAGTALLVKRGRVVGGRIEARVGPEAGGSRVVWEQRLTVRGVPRLLDPLVGLVGRVAYGHVVRRLVRPRGATRRGRGGPGACVHGRGRSSWTGV